ncbi:RodZ domain-containing protein [Candidatus Parabeggiatoa sp. HSG14]|uniref:RodZ domain-containing protein n=1 Tax=Candidatus Parabeggiatoa sp. HSG14 TaxID=3055593 RepID=UPI0025A91EAD|nr:DUF4115 domain-containing protein [Thiotrichales bacterium HSG14]
MNSTTQVSPLSGGASTRYDLIKSDNDFDAHDNIKEHDDINTLHDKYEETNTHPKVEEEQDVLTHGDNAIRHDANEHNDTKVCDDGKKYENTDTYSNIKEEIEEEQDVLTHGDNAIRHTNEHDDTRVRYNKKEYEDSDYSNIEEEHDVLTHGDNAIRCHDANEYNDTRANDDGKRYENTNTRPNVKKDKDYDFLTHDNMEPHYDGILTHDETNSYNAEDYRASNTRYDTTNNYTDFRYDTAVKDDTHISNGDKEQPYNTEADDGYELISKSNETKKTDDDDKEVEKNDDKQVEENLETLSPGTRLRQAREQNNLSIKHIADKLFLDIGVIESLEADKYDHLPPTIFVRGYLRNYAKLLDIPPKSIMASFDRIDQQPTPLLTPHSKQKKQASSRDLWPTLGTGFVIVTLMILMALWQFNQPKTVSIPQSSIVNEQDNNIDSWEPEPLLDTTVITSKLTSTNEIGNNSEKPTETVTEKAEQSITSSSSDVVPSVSENDSENDGETTSSTANKAVNTLRVHFKRRSWLRITDGSGTRLFDRIKKRGEILSLEGTPPFFLNVGNIDGIDVEYQGEIKDVKTYPKKKGYKQTFIVESSE